MANVPEDLKYTKDHEWLKVDGDILTEGISDYAQSELSDIVMVELPEVGKQVKLGDAIGTIEAVKAVVDLYSAVSGEVVEVNEALSQTPEIINKDPYGAGWMVKIRASDPKEIEGHLDANSYKELIGSKAE